MLLESKKLLAQGIAAARADRTGEAKAHLQDALILDPENAEAWLWRARLADSPDDKRAYLEQARALNLADEQSRLALLWLDHPEQKTKHRQLAQAAHKHQHAGRQREAIQAWRDLLALDPANEQATLALMALVSPKQARAVLLRSLKANPHNAMLAVEYAALLTGAGRDQALSRSLQHIDTRGLHTAEAFRKLGDAYRHLEEHAAASRAYEQAITLPGCDPAVYYKLGESYEAGGDHERAVESYRYVVDAVWGTPQAKAAETRLRAISPYLPRKIADSWPFLLREVFGWMLIVGLVAIFDNGMRLAGMDAAGVLAVGLSAVGGLCWSVGRISYGAINLGRPVPITDRTRAILQTVALLLLFVAVLLSLSNAWASTADFLARRFG